MQRPEAPMEVLHPARVRLLCHLLDLDLHRHLRQQFINLLGVNGLVNPEEGDDVVIVRRLPRDARAHEHTRD